MNARTWSRGRSAVHTDGLQSGGRMLPVGESCPLPPYLLLRAARRARSSL